MTEAKDTVSSTLDSATLLRDIASSTGIAPEALEGFLLTDADLDSLCDEVLAKFAVPSRRSVADQG